jgi:hypothetical protein
LALPNVTNLQTKRDQNQAKLNDINSQLDDIALAPDGSQAFILDSLRDETGISLHPFPIAVWKVWRGWCSTLLLRRALHIPDPATFLTLTV